MRRRKRMSDTAFTLLFCAWVLTAVLGLGLAGLNALALLPPPEDHGAGDLLPRVAPRVAAVRIGLGVLLVAWPLAFYRKADAPTPVPGFGRV